MEPGNFNLIKPEPAQESAPNKKPYQKPEMIYLAPLEAMASICIAPGKADELCQFTQS
jgi:hypothetical protein